MNKLAYLEGYMEKISIFNPNKVLSPMYRGAALHSSPHLAHINSLKALSGNIYHATELAEMGHGAYKTGQAMHKARKAKGVLQAGKTGLKAVPKIMGWGGKATAAVPGATKFLGKGILAPAAALAWAGDMGVDGATQMFQDPETGGWNWNVKKNMRGNAEKVTKGAADNVKEYGAGLGTVANAWGGLMNPVQKIMAANVVGGDIISTGKGIMKQRSDYRKQTGRTLDAGAPIAEQEVTNAYANWARANPEQAYKIQVQKANRVAKQRKAMQPTGLNKSIADFDKQNPAETTIPTIPTKPAVTLATPSNPTGTATKTTDSGMTAVKPPSATTNTKTKESPLVEDSPLNT